ncbi:hypothetical protein J2128_000752 [Methanomicrobium sp. W14]|uniref:hypothetical protein n=1 Tax=Methanomicrobium sp. W14 TaxID=2817839 RepID=UPI001AE1784D|nr:hypothetical protein [Methanomicrobium sp. W14]MBP2132831.1 hypothetical protein [Methanomicrobium sp. W14]
MKTEFRDCRGQTGELNESFRKDDTGPRAGPDLTEKTKKLISALFSQIIPETIKDPNYVN